MRTFFERARSFHKHAKKRPGLLNDLLHGNPPIILFMELVACKAIKVFIQNISVFYLFYPFLNL